MGEASGGCDFRLDGFLKFLGVVGTGGEAKMRIQQGEVSVNGEVESRRRKQLAATDVIGFGDETFLVSDYLDGESPPSST